MTRTHVIQPRKIQLVEKFNLISTDLQRRLLRQTFLYWPINKDPIPGFFKCPHCKSILLECVNVVEPPNISQDIAPSFPIRQLQFPSALSSSFCFSPTRSEGSCNATACKKWVTYREWTPPTFIRKERFHASISALPIKPEKLCVWHLLRPTMNHPLFLRWIDLFKHVQTKIYIQCRQKQSL